MSSMDMYKEQILDLFKNPIHFGKLDEKIKTHEGHKHNPSCGDEFTIQLIVNDNKIVDAKFHGAGCANRICLFVCRCHYWKVG
jgi:nitrogen fixation protein NifU and related proteins